jgi:hypothetical protein
MGSFAIVGDPASEIPTEGRIVVGDEYLARAAIAPVGVLKIDVEGFEKPVLEGLRGTLTLHRPIVAVELTIRPDLDSTFRSLAELKASFPDDYSFGAFVKGPPEGLPRKYVIGGLTNDSFQTAYFQVDVAAIPTELAKTALVEDHLIDAAPPNNR